jgi:hypothetical protein
MTLEHLQRDAIGDSCEDLRSGIPAIVIRIRPVLEQVMVVCRTGLVGGDLHLRENLGQTSLRCLNTRRADQLGQ